MPDSFFKIGGSAAASGGAGSGAPPRAGDRLAPLYFLPMNSCRKNQPSWRRMLLQHWCQCTCTATTRNDYECAPSCAGFTSHLHLHAGRSPRLLVLLLLAHPGTFALLGELYGRAVVAVNQCLLPATAVLAVSLPAHCFVSNYA